MTLSHFTLFSITVTGTEVSRVDVISMAALMPISMPQQTRRVVHVEGVSLSITIRW